jgi:hypothetical protein
MSRTLPYLETQYDCGETLDRQCPLGHRLLLEGPWASHRGDLPLQELDRGRHEDLAVLADLVRQPLL